MLTLTVGVPSRPRPFATGRMIDVAIGKERLTEGDFLSIIRHFVRCSNDRIAWVWFLASVLAVLSPACHGAPPIRPYNAKTSAKSDLAPLIVVGVVESNTRIGRPVPSSDDPNIPMQLSRLTLHIENILKGSLKQRTVPVYYYSYTIPYDLQAPLRFGSSLPSRRIFWLRKEGSLYRTACDGRDCTVVVASGAHPGYKPAPGEPLNAMITDLLLTRGEGFVDDHAFAQQISRGAPGDLKHLPGVIDSLSKLALTQPTEPKLAACKQLWIYGLDSIQADLRQKAQESMRAAGCRCSSGPNAAITCE